MSGEEIPSTQVTGPREGVAYGFWLIVVGLVTVTACFALAVLRYGGSSQDVAVALGPVTGVVGSLVGAYFGVKAGADGRREAEQRRSEAEQLATRLAAEASPEVARKVLDTPPSARLAA